MLPHVQNEEGPKKGHTKIKNMHTYIYEKSVYTSSTPHVNTKFIVSKHMQHQI